MSENPKQKWWMNKAVLIAASVVVALTSAGVAALLTDIFQKKVEQRNPYVRVVEVTEEDTDPAKWGLNWPAQYDGYKRTALRTQTRFGGHGGSETLPAEKIDRDPWLKRMFLGYAFSIDACSLVTPSRSTIATAVGMLTCSRIRSRPSGSPSRSRAPACTATPPSCRCTVSSEVGTP